MEVKAVDIQIPNKLGNGSLLAFGSIILDRCFVVKNLRIVRHPTRDLMVCMPSTKQTHLCRRCRAKNSLDAKYCTNCGVRLPEVKLSKDDLHSDVAHPINSECRRMIEHVVLKAYADELAIQGKQKKQQ